MGNLKIYGINLTFGNRRCFDGVARPAQLRDRNLLAAVQSVHNLHASDIYGGVLTSPLFTSN